MSTTSGFAYKTETPLVETVTGTTGYPLGTEYYPYPGQCAVKTVGATPYTGCTSGVVVPCVETSTNVPYSTYKYVVDVVNVAEDSYLTGYQIEGRVLYPTTGYLYLVWKSLAKLNGYSSVEQVPIVFENVEILRATILATKLQVPTKQIEFCVRIVPKTGVFELFEGENVIVTGRVCVPESVMKLEQLKSLVQQQFTQLNERRRLVEQLEQEEIYRELRGRGYEYCGEFQPLFRADAEGTCAELLYTGKWIPFLDAMLQLYTLGQKRITSGVVLPIRFRSIRIDPIAHCNVQKLVARMVKSISLPSFRTVVGGCERPCLLPAFYEPINSRIVCGGVEIVGVNSTCTGIQNFCPTTNVVSPICTPIVSSSVYGNNFYCNNFVPYVEKNCEEEYVIVDKCGGVEAEPTPVCRQSREFLEFYLNECRRYVSHILRRIEQPTTVLACPMPTVIPRTIEQQLECLRIAPSATSCPTVFGTEYTGTPYGRLLEGGKLLQLLIQCANCESVDGQYLCKIQKIFNERFAYPRALEEDCILNLVNNRSYYLKSILDTVLENIHGICSGSVVVPRTVVSAETCVPKIKVLEISPSVSQFFGAKVSNLMRLYPTNFGEVEYHYVPSVLGTQPCTVVPEEYICELNKQLPYEIKKAEINFGLRNGQLFTEVPAHCCDYDLVIFNGGLSSLLSCVESEYELKRFIQTVVLEKILKPQGFMLVHEYTNSLELLSQLYNLEQLLCYSSSPLATTPFKYTTGRLPYCKYLSETQCRQFIEECGLCPISIKSDVALSSLFLCRRPVAAYCPASCTTVPTVVPFEEKILIDECGIEQACRRVRLALAEKQFERVWLCSEREPTVEIVSAINRLRREIGGERIRCLFAADRTPVCVFGKRYPVPSFCELVQTPSCELFNIVRRADLVMNVFRNGQFGSFRPIVNVRPTPYFPVSPVSNYCAYPTTTGSGYPYPYTTGSSYPYQYTTGWTYPYPYSTGSGYPYPYPFVTGAAYPYSAYCPTGVVSSRYPVPCTFTHLPVGCPFEYPAVCSTIPETVSGCTTTVPCYENEFYQNYKSPFVFPRQWATSALCGPSAASRVCFNPLQTYVITCGLGSFGLELLEFIVEHGARRVVVTSKYGVRSGYQARKLRILRDEFNACIRVLQAEVREEAECLSLIQEAVQLSAEGKIGGIFHVASCVEDALFEQQYPVSQVQEVLRKINEFRCQGAFNLDKLTRAEGIMNESGYFVVFSPVLSQITTPSVLEKICESRRRVGRHGLCVNFGCGLEFCLPVEQTFCYDNACEVPTSVYNSRILSCLPCLESILIKSVEPTCYSHYVPIECLSEVATPYSYGVSPYTYGCTPYTAVQQYRSLVDVLCAVLGVKDYSRIAGCESVVTLGELGLDSVLSLELKQFLESAYSCPLTLRDIQLLTIEKLRRIESRFPYAIRELYVPRPFTYLPRLRSVIAPRTCF